MVARTAAQPRIQPTDQTTTGRINGVTDYAVTNHDPFPYGWRTMAETLATGETIYHDIPLTQADFLNPQLGDHMVQSDAHFILVVSLYNRFHKRYLNHPTIGVFSDIKMLWGIEDLPEPAPDLAVVPQLSSKHAYHSSFDVRKEQTRPCLIVEVVSPHYPGDDTDKVDIYERVGITEYIIIDPHFNDETAPITLIGYRLVNGVYAEIQPDAQGRLLSETTGVWFGLDASQRTLLLIDAATSAQLFDDEEEYEARLEAEARATEEAQRAAAETQRANSEAQRAAVAEAEIARLKALLAQKGESQ
ncbi:MAG: Uma2 family endonuclease [Caldilineaceae bacterium]